MVYAVGASEKELIAWCWGINRPQGQLSERGKSPARGQVENGSPLLIREVVFVEISGKYIASARGQRALRTHFGYMTERKASKSLRSTSSNDTVLFRDS
jgi:hypothetical protein